MLKTVLYAISITLSTLAFLYFGGYDRQKDAARVQQDAFKQAGLIEGQKGLSDQAMGKDGADSWFASIAGFGGGPKTIKVEAGGTAAAGLPRYTLIQRQGQIPPERQLSAAVTVQVVDREGETEALTSEVD